MGDHTSFVGGRGRKAGVCAQVLRVVAASTPRILLGLSANSRGLACRATAMGGAHELLTPSHGRNSHSARC
jgi:hypothetical protein